MNEFARFHPWVIFIYFLSAFLVTCAHINPICVAIAFCTAFSYCAVVKGKKTLYKNLAIMPLLLCAMALINPAFNHRGVTILTYLPSGNPLTAESICFGFIAAGMALSIMLYFSCFNEIMTSDKIIYIFGKIIPSLSLIFSMTLRTVPIFRKRIKAITRAQKCIGRSPFDGAPMKRVKSGLAILSIMITWSMENAIETADSMKSRGFGVAKRTSFSIYSFTKRDKKVLFAICILSAYVAIGGAMGVFSFACFPYISMAKISPYAFSVYFAELLLFIIPIIVEVTELKKWKSTN